MNADSTWKKRRHDQLAVADLVDDDAADDDAEAETCESSAADRPELRTGEAELGRPVGEDAAADAEADAGFEDGQEASPQQALGVGAIASLLTVVALLIVFLWMPTD